MASDANSAKQDSVGSGVERSVATTHGRTFWAIFAALGVGLIPGLLLSGSGPILFSSVALLVVGAFAARRTSLWIARPIHVLKKRLEIKNYGIEAPRIAPTLPEVELDLQDNMFEVLAAIWAKWHGDVPVDELDINEALPSELREIERLSRSGTASEVAIAAVKRDLFKHLSHQLKSPLATMRAKAYLVRSRLDIESKEERDHAVEVELKEIDGMAMGMARLVETIMSLAYIDSLEQRLPDTVRCNLSEIVIAAAASRETAARERGLQIKTSVMAGLWVNGQVHLLQELVTSILDNAIRYSFKGTEICVEAGLISGTRSIQVLVVDQGPGIPEQERKRVFDPFYGSTGTDEHGRVTYGARRHRVLGHGADRVSNGLGLSLVRSICRLMGGAAMIEDGRGGLGTTVRVLLPEA